MKVSYFILLHIFTGYLFCRLLYIYIYALFLIKSTITTIQKVQTGNIIMN